MNRAASVAATAHVQVLVSERCEVQDGVAVEPTVVQCHTSWGCVPGASGVDDPR